MRFDPTYTFRALRHRNFRLFFIGQSLSLIGTWLQQVAMGWLTYRLTGSAWVLGAVAFCGSIGILVLGPFAGVIADRVNRRRALYCHPVAAAHAVARARRADGVRPRRGLASRLPSRSGSASCRRSTCRCGRRSTFTSSTIATICPTRSRSIRSSSTWRGSSGRRSPACCCRWSARRFASRSTRFRSSR